MRTRPSRARSFEGAGTKVRARSVSWSSWPRRSSRTADPEYAYHPGLDFHGHMTGPGSDCWLSELAAVDAAARAIADRLPADAALFVTGDHGMVTLMPEQKIDVVDEPVLMAGVRFLAGEGRARHVLAVPGAERESSPSGRTSSAIGCGS